MTDIIESIFISGRPQTFGDKRYEDPWKTRIASEIKKQFGDKPKVKEKVQLVLKFFIFKNRKVDLDNLIKPCMDAVGSVIFEHRGRTQSIWDTDDVWVYKIIAEKELVETEDAEGVEIKVERL